MKAYFAFAFASINAGYIMHMGREPLCMMQLENKVAAPPPQMTVRGMMPIPFREVKIHQRPASQSPSGGIPPKRN